MRIIRILPCLAFVFLSIIHQSYSFNDDTISTSSSETPRSQRTLASLAQKWNITDPEFSYGALEFNLDFETSDFILDTMATTRIYDQQCADGNYEINSNILSSVFTPDNTPNGEGDLMRNFNLEVTINPETITSDSNVYSESVAGGVTAEIRFCVRFSLWTPSAEPIEVNFRETIVTLNVDLTDGFEIDTLNVAPRDRIARTANQVYQVEAFQCNINNVPLTPSELLEARNQGSIIRVCVRPDENARNDGIYMRRIDNFAFERDYGGAIGVDRQVAVENGQAAANLLTELFCNEGDEICVFETILLAVFFRISGSVDGTGVASMQFGDGTTRRNLRNASRQAQEQNAAAVAEFELSFETLPRPDLRYQGSGANSITSSFFGISLLSCLLTAAWM